MGARRARPELKIHHGEAERNRRPSRWPLTRDDLVLAVLWMAVLAGALALAAVAALNFR